MDAIAQIKAELQDERRVRNKRGAIVVLILLALSAAFVFKTGLKPHFSTQDIVAQVLTGLFFFATALLSLSSKTYLRGSQPYVLAGFMGVIPLLAMSALVRPDEPWSTGIKCFGVIIVLGALALTLTRLVLGARQRRFGGVPTLLGLCAAMFAAASVGLHCEMQSGLHFLGHTAAILVVSVVLRRLFLR